MGLDVVNTCLLTLFSTACSQTCRTLFSQVTEMDKSWPCGAHSLVKVGPSQPLPFSPHTERPQSKRTCQTQTQNYPREDTL